MQEIGKAYETSKQYQSALRGMEMNSHRGINYSKQNVSFQKARLKRKKKR